MSTANEQKAPEPTHYVLLQGPNPFCKEGRYFRQQGGLHAEWGKKWVPVVAKSREDAIEIAKLSSQERAALAAPEGVEPEKDEWSDLRKYAAARTIARRAWLSSTRS